ncbi:MAG: hypothetical protein M1814_003093 [Vezdaea aestivalis]|nr:MAG: hypothetical protein M1814_003093 [Vezdaea aestivalis]
MATPQDLKFTKKSEKENIKSKEDPGKQAAVAVLEEDDEFEDFPVEDWTAEDTEMPGGNEHLWEESWDDDDTNDDFSQQLKEELKKVKEQKS